MHSLRHFVRRDRFVVDTKEGYQVSQASEIDRVKKGKKRKNCGDGTVGEQSRGIYGVTTIPLKQTLQTLNSKEVDIHIASYIFSTPKVPGKFQVKKAKELGIPPGPMYATLKGGASVTFKHPLTGIETTVQPHEVLEGGSDGVSAIVLYCPDEVVMEQLCGGVTHGANPGMEQLELLKVGSERNANLEAIIHFTPKTLFFSPKYQTWLANFGVKVKHIALHPIERQSWNGGNEEVDGSPFKAAMLGAMTRNLLNPEIYQNPICPIRPDETLKELPNQSAQNYIKALRHMEYKLIPLSKQGIVPESISNRSGDDYRSGISAEERLAIENLTIESGAKSSSNAIRERDLEELSHSEDDQNENQIPSNENLSGGEFFFTGTGSAIPCKHRNVTGKLNSNRWMVFFFIMSFHSAHSDFS
jgi:ribonuclease Z